MRILHVCTGFTPRKLAHNGGGRRYWQNLASLVALGHEGHLVVCGTNEQIETEVQRLPNSIEYIDDSTRSITRFESWRAVLNPHDALRFYVPSIVGLRKKI